MVEDHAKLDAPSLSPAGLQRLRAAAQARGRLTLDDLKRIVPIDQLTPEQLARVVGQLDDAAIDVAFDPALMRRPRKPAPTLESGFRIAADGEDADYTRAHQVPLAREAIGPAPRTPALSAPVPDNRRVTALTVGLVVLVCAVLGYIANLLI